jgi:hypothetical protein
VHSACVREDVALLVDLIEGLPLRYEVQDPEQVLVRGSPRPPAVDVDGIDDLDGPALAGNEDIDRVAPAVFGDVQDKVGGTPARGWSEIT